MSAMSEPSPDAVVVVPESSRQRNALYGLLSAAFLAAGVRGAIGASSTSGRISALVVFGAVLGLVLAGWLRARRHPDHLEVSSTTIRYVSGAGRQTRAEPRPVLSRQAGRDLRFSGSGTGRFVSLVLSQPAAGTGVPIRMFSRRAVQDACVSQGWTFGQNR